MTVRCRGLSIQIQETKFDLGTFPRTFRPSSRHAKRCRKAMIKKLFLCVTALLISVAVHAQPTSGSPDPKAGAEMTGTIKEYTPGTGLVLETLAPSEPVQFKLSKTVTYA